MRRTAQAFLLLLCACVPSFSQSTDVIVTLKSSQAIESINRQYKGTTKKQIPGANVYLISIENADSQTLKKLQQEGNVDSTELNASISLADSGETLFLLDDNAETLYLLDSNNRTTLSGVDVPKVYAEQPALARIEGDTARATSTGAATKIVTIDTGVDFNHPALRPWLDPGVDLVNGRSASELDGVLADSGETLFLLDDGSTTRATSFGHGTLVAGMVHLVAPDAIIVPIKAFDALGRTTTFTIVEAVYKAIDAGADVINMSFSTSQYSTALERALSKAHAAGITVVAAMGNTGQRMDTVFPAAYSSVIGVAATDLDDHVTSFSTYGKAASISAPGADVVSTAPGGRYARISGTSFSSPLVSGAVALLSSLQNRGLAQGLLVVNAADTVDAKNPGFEKLLGSGRVNARLALMRLQ